MQLCVTSSVSYPFGENASKKPIKLDRKRWFYPDEATGREVYSRKSAAGYVHNRYGTGG